jgi:hypothetical protein
MNSRKTKGLNVRLTPAEHKMLTQVSSKCEISMAEVFVLGLITVAPTCRSKANYLTAAAAAYERIRAAGWSP